MKRIFSLILCLLLAAVWTVPVSAADLYSDAELTDFVGTIYSQSFTVPEAEKPTIPEITTEQPPTLWWARNTA